MARGERSSGRWRFLALAAVAVLGLASCGPSTTAPTTLVVVNQSPRSVTLQWDTSGFLGPIGASTRSEDIAGCARDNHGVMTSDTDLVIRSFVASLPVALPQPAEMATLYYLVRPDGQIEATTADIAGAIPTPGVDAPVPGVCPTPSGMP
jgi:hypothetical protein